MGIYGDKDIINVNKKQIKSKLENNEIMHNIMLKCGLIGYAYNAKHFQSDAGIPDHEKVVTKGHDPYIEAIVGAVFYDSNYDTPKRWILKWLLPLKTLRTCASRPAAA